MISLRLPKKRDRVGIEQLRHKNSFVAKSGCAAKTV
jgi:hypothetical protein